MGDERVAVVGAGDDRHLTGFDSVDGNGGQVVAERAAPVVGGHDDDGSPSATASILSSKDSTILGSRGGGAPFGRG